MQWCLQQTQPLSARSLYSYWIYQDQNVWVFFRLLGPAVLLEEQHSLWKYYRTLVKKHFFLLHLPFVWWFWPCLRNRSVRGFPCWLCHRILCDADQVVLAHTLGAEEHQYVAVCQCHGCRKHFTCRREAVLCWYKITISQNLIVKVPVI